MLSDDSIVAIVTAVIGSGGLGGLTGWFSQHLAKRKSILTRDDLQPIKEKLDRDFEHFRQVDDQVRDIKLIVLRQCLFARPRDHTA
ncbi:MAG: hypothetical protein ABF507_03995, partial [Bifidobacterium aquikefiri]|uniref:hypothetical protein n=1 Tax=Bifidobacterium aquikefiri TaxID=1653207 RepID=UPI0039EC0814